MILIPHPALLYLYLCIVRSAAEAIAAPCYCDQTQFLFFRIDHSFARKQAPFGYAPRMGKVKPAPQGAEKSNPNSRRSSRGTTPKEDNAITGTPAAAPPPGPSTLERPRLAATLPGLNTASGAKRPPSTGRKLSALSAHKRRLPTDGATPGRTPSTSKRQLSSPPQKQATGTPSQEPQMEGAKSPPGKGAPPMTVAEVKNLINIIYLLTGSSFSQFTTCFFCF